MSLEEEPKNYGILRVREGHGANCSSVGSVVDTLFVGAVVGGAVLAAVAAALRREPVEVIGEDPPSVGGEARESESPANEG